jgi:hypothetical protein
VEWKLAADTLRIGESTKREPLLAKNSRLGYSAPLTTAEHGESSCRSGRPIRRIDNRGVAYPSSAGRRWVYGLLVGITVLALLSPLRSVKLQGYPENAHPTNVVPAAATTFLRPAPDTRYPEWAEGISRRSGSPNGQLGAGRSTRSLVVSVPVGYSWVISSTAVAFFAVGSETTFDT